VLTFGGGRGWRGNGGRFHAFPRRLIAILGVLLMAGAGSAAAQDSAAVRLDLTLAGNAHDPLVRTENLLEDTPWLSALRQGLPVRLQYRLEIWRSREAWLDEVQRQIEWTVVIRHEPLLDQFSVVRLLPNGVRRNVYGTPGALAAALGVPVRFTVAPREPGTFYYAASLAVATLSDSDLDQFERILRGELDPANGEGGTLLQRARRLVLRLAGLPTANLTARSESFEVK
jgi:hypothetical protein